MSGNLPDAKVEVAFSSDPTAPAVWVDVTQWVQSFSTQRGRQRELNAIQTGTATVLFDNRDRRFDPLNTAGPYSGQILPARRIRISGVWGGITYPQIQAYVESWPQTWQGPFDANCQVVAADGFKILNLAQIPVNSSFPQERSDVRIGDVLTAINWTVGGPQWTLGDAVLGHLGTTTVLGPTGDRALSPGLTQIQASILAKTSALAHMQDVAQTENGLLFMSKAGQVTFLAFRPNPPASSATFGELELVYTGLTLQYDDNTIYNSVHMTRVGGTEQIAEDATSKGNYFIRTLSFTNTLQDTDGHALGMATFLLGTYKQPFVEVIGMDLDGVANPASLWPQILGREIGDVVTVNRRPPGGGPMISQTSMIQGIHVSYTANGGDWLTTWQLTATTPGATYWQLGDAVLSILGSGGGTGTTKLFY